MFLGDFGKAVEALTIALDEMREAVDPEGIGRVQTALGLVAALIEGPDQMMVRMNEAIEIFREFKDEWALIMPLTAIGWLAVGMDLPDVPERELQGSRCLGQETGRTAREVHGDRHVRMVAPAFGSSTRRRTHKRVDRRLLRRGGPIRGRARTGSRRRPRSTKRRARAGRAPVRRGRCHPRGPRCPAPSGLRDAASAARWKS